MQLCSTSHSIDPEGLLPCSAYARRLLAPSDGGSGGGEGYTSCSEGLSEDEEEQQQVGACACAAPSGLFTCNSQLPACSWQD